MHVQSDTIVSQVTYRFVPQIKKLNHTQCLIKMSLQQKKKMKLVSHHAQ